MIELTNVTLTFPDGAGRVRAVDDVSLTVARGTVTGLTGPSGSGKSSLLAVTAALIKPDAGRAVIDGVDATSLNARGAATLRRERIGIVFQQANLVPSLTALEQLVVMDHLGGARRGESVIEKARALLDAVGMAEHAHKRPHQLSGGQRQRVNIARALVNDPAALVVDEPTSARSGARKADHGSDRAADDAAPDSDAPGHPRPVSRPGHARNRAHAGWAARSRRGSRARLSAAP